MPPPQISDYVDQEVPGNHLVLTHGQWWTPAPLPPELDLGEPKQCYANAGEIANREFINTLLAEDDPDNDDREPVTARWRYCEGWAVRSGPPSTFVFEHAWLIDENDQALDVTLAEPADFYFGVILASDLHRDRMMETYHWGPHLVDNHGLDWLEAHRGDLGWR